MCLISFFAPTTITDWSTPCEDAASSRGEREKKVGGRFSDPLLVPLSKLIKNVTRATALDEIEIFEANMVKLRANEFDELSSEEDEDEDDE